MRGFLILTLSMGLASNCWADVQNVVNVVLPLDQGWPKEQPGATLDEVKQKWANWANAAVEKERDEFIQNFCLNKDCLNDPKLADEAKASINSAISVLLPYYQELDDSTAEEKECIQAIANEIFKDVTCKIIDCKDLPMYGTCVMDDCSNCCYVCMNVKEFVKNLDQAEDVLRHEYSHVVHKDVFYRQIIIFASKVALESPDKPYAFCRAFETRADVQAAINSRYHGNYFIDFLKAVPGYIVSEVHPLTGDRIALLEKIKQELDVAIKK